MALGEAATSAATLHNIECTIGQHFLFDVHDFSITSAEPLQIGPFNDADLKGQRKKGSVILLSTRNVRNPDPGLPCNQCDVAGVSKPARVRYTSRTTVREPKIAASCIQLV